MRVFDGLLFNIKIGADFSIELFSWALFKIFGKSLFEIKINKATFLIKVTSSMISGRFF